MNRYIIGIFLILILLFIFNHNSSILDNFIDSHSNRPCYDGTNNFPSYFKVGEISKNNKNNYHEYLNKLHNSHNKKIAKYNYGCNDCQRLNN